MPRRMRGTEGFVVDFVVTAGQGLSVLPVGVNDNVHRCEGLHDGKQKGILKESRLRGAGSIDSAGRSVVCRQRVAQRQQWR